MYSLYHRLLKPYLKRFGALTIAAMLAKALSFLTMLFVMFEFQTDQFGIYTLMVFWSNLIISFANVGPFTYFVSLSKLDSEHVSTVQLTELFKGAIIVTAAYPISIMIERNYENNFSLVFMIFLLSGVINLTKSVYVHIEKVKRNYFWDAFYTLIPPLLILIITILYANFGTITLLNIATFYLLAQIFTWTVVLIRFGYPISNVSYRYFKEFIAYHLKITYTSIITTIQQQSTPLLMAKILSHASFGQFYVVYQVLNLIPDTITKPMTQVMMIDIRNNLQTGGDRFDHVFRAYKKQMLFIATLLILILSLILLTVTTYIQHEKLHGLAAYISPLALVVFLRVYYNIYASLFYPLGKPHYLGYALNAYLIAFTAAVSILYWVFGAPEVLDVFVCIYLSYTIAIFVSRWLLSTAINSKFNSIGANDE